jgi:hypothetical protein
MRKYRVMFNRQTVSTHRTLAAAKRSATREARLAESCGADCPTYIVADDEAVYGQRLYQASTDGDHISLVDLSQ